MDITVAARRVGVRPGGGGRGRVGRRGGEDEGEGRRGEEELTDKSDEEVGRLI